MVDCRSTVDVANVEGVGGAGLEGANKSSNRGEGEGQRVMVNGGARNGRGCDGG